MPLRTRTRSLPSTLTAESGVRIGAEPYSPLVQTWTFPGYQTTISEGHPWSSRKKGSRDDIGGNFYSIKSYANLPVIEKKLEVEFAPTQFSVVDGFYSPNIPPDTWWLRPPSLESSDDDLIEAGATAIANCEPTKSIAQASTAIGELMKDKVPNLPILHSLEKRAGLAVSAGEEFLNTAFGWLPLVNDVRDLAHGVTKLEERLSFLERNSGKTVRRKFKFDSITSHRKDVVPNQQVKLAFGEYQNLIGDTGQRGEILVEVDTSIDRWFSGAFVFYLPSDYDSRSAIRKQYSSAKQLLGIELTPETLWNLAPWSWAVDWFTNADDVVHNVSKFTSGQLVLQYGYIMEHTVHKYTVRHNGPSGLVGVGSVPPFEFITETKKRLAANPYGFGASWDGLSAFQLSVLAALGITRGR